MSDDRKRNLEYFAARGVKPGDIVYDPWTSGEDNSCNWHICYDNGRGYSPEIRDLGHNNCGMADLDGSHKNYGHISKCYKSLPIKFGANDWEYYFQIPAHRDLENNDWYNLQDQTPEELNESLKRNNFPEGWTLPEEDKE